MLLLSLLLAGGLFLEQSSSGNTLHLYVNVEPQGQKTCLEVVTYSHNGYVAFKTGDIPQQTTNYVATWDRQGLRPGYYMTDATLKTDCSDEGKVLATAKAPTVRIS